MRHTKGFTLIELLIVVVIIGILAAVAILKFANVKEKAYLSGMKSDLRNLVTAQESYFADNVTYANSTTSLTYNQSAGNAVSITAATATGWSATASNNATTRTCGIYVGSATPPFTGQIDGTPQCQ